MVKSLLRMYDIELDEKHTGVASLPTGASDTRTLTTIVELFFYRTTF